MEYEDEYYNCKSIRDRFQQYFVHGEVSDCTSWKRDFDNCLKYKETEDENVVVRNLLIYILKNIFMLKFQFVIITTKEFLKNVNDL